MKGVAVVVAALLIWGSAWLALFPPVASRIELNQFRAVHSLRELHTAEGAFAARNVRLGFTCDLSQLSDAVLIDGVLAGGDKAGYRFWLTDCATDANGAVISYQPMPLQRTQNSAPSLFVLMSMDCCGTRNQLPCPIVFTAGWHGKSRMPLHVDGLVATNPVAAAGVWRDCEW